MGSCACVPLCLCTSNHVRESYPVEVGDGLEGRPFLLFLGSCGGLLLFEKQSQQVHGGLLEESHHRLIQRVFILLQPASDVVAHLREVQTA